MNFSMEKDKLVDYMHALLMQYLPDKNQHKISPQVMSLTFESLSQCFKKIGLRYYRSADGTSYFNHLNSDHMCIFIYKLSHQAFLYGDELLATKLFYLNKIMHGLDLFYSVELPTVFLPVHPVGSVIGHGKFGEGFVFYQNVTVGSDIDGVFPSFGAYNVLYSGVTVLGKTSTGSNTVFGANSFSKNLNSPDDTAILGHYPNNKLSSTKLNIAEDIFKDSTTNKSAP